VNSRARDRFAAVVSLLLLACLAAGSYYLAEISRRFAIEPGQASLRHEPDYFVEGLVFTRVSARGDPAFRLSAERMVHYPDDQAAEYTRPEVVSLDPARPQLRVVSDRGRSGSDGVETHLDGNVVMTREAGDGDPAMTIRTDHVVIYSDTEIAKTDRPVTIERGGSTLTGVGMQFDNPARSLTVDSQVRGIWQPPPRNR
jgi:lipopolysaccharide export system protein LptC